MWKNKVVLVVLILSLVGCTNKHEAGMNNQRTQAWENVNTKRTFSPVTITGITSMTGDITITTTAEHTELEAPDLQYDTSDTDMIKTGLGIAGAVIGGKILSDSQKVQVVEQPAPVIVEQPAPIIVQ